jgi:hypothetical protein
MSDPNLFDLIDTQHAHLERVGDRIAGVVLQFCGVHDQFHLQQLEDFVAERIDHVTPGSAGRILRDLRRRGDVDYRVVSRRDSLYAIERAAA